MRIFIYVYLLTNLFQSPPPFSPQISQSIPCIHVSGPILCVNFFFNLVLLYQCWIRHPSFVTFDYHLFTSYLYHHIILVCSCLLSCRKNERLQGRNCVLFFTAAAEPSTLHAPNKNLLIHVYSVAGKGKTH